LTKLIFAVLYMSQMTGLTCCHTTELPILEYSYSCWG